MLLLDTEPTQLIMVSYFRPNDFETCVQSVLRNTRPPFHLSILDNSHGGLEEKLQPLEDHQNITIYRNETNIGKGTAFRTWYRDIMRKSKTDHFISIDSDLLVPPDWLTKMQIAMYQIRADQALGILAPVIMDEPHETFEYQQQHKFNMHKPDENTQHVRGAVYRNRFTAGPLFLIDRKFYENVGGYVQNQLYGNDDGRLCAAAARKNRFIGIVSDVHVLHLRQDDDSGYRAWKLRNVNKVADRKGYWD